MKRNLLIFVAVLSLFFAVQYAYSTTTTDGNSIVSGTLAVTGHTTFEGVTSTGATGSGRLVYDTSPTIATAILTTPNIGSAAANGVNYCADAAGSSTTYTCTVTGLTAYTTGMLITFKPGTANTGGSTLNINSLGAKSIIAANVTGSALVADDLLANGIYTLEYDGTNLRRINGPDGAWTAFAYSNSWADFGSGLVSGAYMKDRNGFVRMRGVIKPGTTTAGTTMITLPAGYRPPTATILAYCFNDQGTAATTLPVRLGLATTGVITNNFLFVGTYCSMEATSFSVY